MNWCKGFVKKDKLEMYIQKIKTRFLDPPPKGEFCAGRLLYASPLDSWCVMLCGGYAPMYEQRELDIARVYTVTAWLLIK